MRLITLVVETVGMAHWGTPEEVAAAIVFLASPAARFITGAILAVDPHVEEMITMFQVNGAMIHVDPDGATLGYDDVFTRIMTAAWSRTHDRPVAFG